MEKRTGNIIIQMPGGTAAKNSRTYKVSLPSAWVKELGVTEKNRQIELRFDGKTISISKQLTADEFISTAKEQNHDLYLLFYYDGNSLCSKIAADYSAHELCVENYASDYIRTAFGNNRTPTWEDYLLFLEDRCIPRTRAGLREYLEVIGVESYDPLEIIKRTEGRMAEDSQWLKVEAVT